MPIKRCSNPSCSRPFKLNAYSASADRSRQPGKINCPHCGAAMQGGSDSIYLTHALSKVQEARFAQTHYSEREEELSLNTTFLNTRING